MTSHSVRRHPAIALALALGAVLVLAACNRSAEEVRDDPSEASVALEQQRLDVRELAGQLRNDVVDDLHGVVVRDGGRWDGCEGGGAGDVFTSMRYLATVGLTAQPDLFDNLGAASEDLLSGAGLRLEDSGKASVVQATGDDLVASMSQSPPGSSTDLLLMVQGPCVDLPADEREYWTHRPAVD